MKFLLQLRTNTDAFEPDPAIEIVEILRDVADRISREGLSGLFETIHDSSGNDVGRYAIKPDDYS